MNDCALSPDLPLALKAYAKDNRIPLSATFELTPFCNFSCVMCYVRLNSQQAKEQGELLTAEQWLDIARQAKEMGTLYVVLTGGEPLARPDFWEIYSRLNKMGFLISVLSNGSLIDEAAMEKFRLYGMPYSVKLTLYGASDETYKKVCSSNDGFTKIRKAVALLKAAGVPLSMTATVVRENADDLQAIYQAAREWGVPLQHTVSVVKSARGAVNSAEKSRFMFDEFVDELTLEKLEKNKFPPLESPFAWCSGYGSSFWLTWNGHLQLCSFMNGPYSDINKGLAEAWQELNVKLESLKSPAECSECEYSEFCQRCPGILCAESGSAERAVPSLCETARHLYMIYHEKLKRRNEA